LPLLLWERLNLSHSGRLDEDSIYGHVS
jgi:hypothetical protein